jgi:hypothetical protein
MDIEAAAQPPPPPDAHKRLLGRITDVLKSITSGPIAFARALTLIERRPRQDQINYTPNAQDNGFDVPSSLSIVINEYVFTLVSKSVLFDRRYVNFNVYRILTAEEAALPPLDTDIVIQGIRRRLIDRLAAYASSSQVGSWRLCKTESGNRLNKFDDYVQSTVIQWKLTRFICYWFYRYELLWDDEPLVQDVFENTPAFALAAAAAATAAAIEKNRQITIRNTKRNNLFGVPNTRDRCHTWVNGKIAPPPGYNVHTIPRPAAAAAGENFLAAIPYVYVMEGGLYEYKTLPRDYLARTGNDLNITCQIVDRGLGSTYKYSNTKIASPCSDNIGPLPAPCPFQYWADKGTCGDQNSEPNILAHLNEFSDTLNRFYDIDNVPNPRQGDPPVMKITELYRDCMIYKNFKQEATVFKVRLIPKAANMSCIPPNQFPIPDPNNFYKQSIDIIFVNFRIKQYTFIPDICLEPCYALDPQPEPQVQSNKKQKVEPDFNVQGYYVLTIIPTQVLISPEEPLHRCEFNRITRIGLYEYYIKAGYYVCKPLDYKGQCILRSFPINPGAQVVPQTINVEYVYIGHRLNGQEPFNRLFGFEEAEKQALATYSEQIINREPNSDTGLIRTCTGTDDLLKVFVEQMNGENGHCKKSLPSKNTKQKQKIKKDYPQGGTKKQNKTNKKHYRTNMQTNKIRKCKNKKKRTTKKQRTTKKRRI